MRGVILSIFEGFSFVCSVGERSIQPSSIFTWPDIGINVLEDVADIAHVAGPVDATSPVRL